MGTFYFASWGGGIPSLLPGSDVPLYLEVGTMGTAGASEVSDIRIRIFRIDSNGTEQVVTDRGGVVMDNVPVPLLRGTLYRYTFKSSVTHPDGLYFAEWTGAFRSENIPTQLDRFVLQGDESIDGDVEIEGTSSV